MMAWLEEDSDGRDIERSGNDSSRTGRQLQSSQRYSIRTINQYNEQDPLLRNTTTNAVSNESDQDDSTTSSNNQLSYNLPQFQQFFLGFRRQSSASDVNPGTSAMPIRSDSSREFSSSLELTQDTRPTAPSSRTTRNQTATTREQRNTPSQTNSMTEEDELSALLRRCQNTFPFLLLLGLYFLIEHIIGILVTVGGTLAILGLDRWLREQIALKENAKLMQLGTIFMLSWSNLAVLLYLNGGINTLKNMTNIHGIFDVLWIVMINDIAIRLISISVKTTITAIGWHAQNGGNNAEHQSQNVRNGVSNDLEIGISRRSGVSEQTALVNTNNSGGRMTFSALHKRKRKLYAIVEMFSILVRSSLATIPWCYYYNQGVSSAFFAGNLIFIYLLIKGYVLGQQARAIVALTISTIFLRLEHGVYVSTSELPASATDCPICYDPLTVPVKLDCDHTFCETCLGEWLDRERTCPLCRAIVRPSSRASENPVETGSNSILPSFDINTVKCEYLNGRTSILPQLF